MSHVCVHGLGYIGLPTAAMLANYGHEVVGYDVDDSVRTKLNNGEVHIDEPGLRAFVTQAIESGQLEFSDDIVPAKYHIMCLPTPLNEQTMTAELDHIGRAGTQLADYLRKGDTVILESTVPPGTTVDVLQPRLESSDLEAGTDFALVHCPETVLPGNIISELRENDRVIGGVNGLSTESAVRLYESFVEGEIRTTQSPTAAEFVKLIQNTYRDTNIALANEIGKIANDYGIDTLEAIELANGHPRVDLLYPGPGVGGHCLPVDPWFLGQNSDSLELITTARRVNDGMTDYVIDRLEHEVGSLAEKKIAVLGLAYKGNVGDTRMSPGLKLADRLQERVGANGSAAPTIDITDPHVTDQTLSLKSLTAALDGADVAVITTDHDEYRSFEGEELRSKMRTPIVFDTKGIVDSDLDAHDGITLYRL